MNLISPVVWAVLTSKSCVVKACNSALCCQRVNFVTHSSRDFCLGK